MILVPINPSNEQSPQQEGPADEALVRTIVAGRGSGDARRAANELFDRYRRPVFLFCCRYMGSSDDAMDVSQDVLIRAYERLESFGERARFSSWLFSIARNRCIDVLRSRPRTTVDADDVLDMIVDTAPTPDRATEDKDNEERLLGWIRSVLDPLEQQAVWMRCVDRRSVDDITRLLEIESPSGARGVLQSARRKLRTAREQKGD